MRENKYRVWDVKNRKMVYDGIYDEHATFMLFLDGRLNLEGTFVNQKYFILMQFLGRTDPNNIDIYDRDFIQIELPEIINDAYGDGLHEPACPEVMVSPNKKIIGEVRISKTGNVGVIVRKIWFPDKNWEENIPNINVDDELNIKTYKVAKIGTRLKIRKNDIVIGNSFENPELLK